MIELVSLLPNYPLPLPALQIGGLKLDSRQVASGDAFVAVPGYQVDGRDYIDAAIEAGAVVVLTESESVGMQPRGRAWVIEVPGLKNQLSFIAARFFGEPAQHLQVVGVTGTNGKTSVTYLVAQLLDALGVRCGVIGTTGSGFSGKLLPETHTTPDAIAVQQRLRVLQAEGAQAVAMEVSSHALVQCRVEAIQFAVGVATNISRDHLDYHGTMSNYAGAKRRLFTELDTRHAVLNADDAAVAAWLPDRQDSWRFSLNPQSAERSLWATQIGYAQAGTDFTVQARLPGTTEVVSLPVQSPLLGHFNVYNLLAAMAAVASLGHDLSAIAKACAGLHAVPGRMEVFGGSQGKPLVIVDYAHTPDALQQVLTALRRHCRGQLWCVFGCGGDRDRGKRPQMGAVAAELADRVVVTDDNPRTEDPAQIVQDILAGMPRQQRVQVLMGRAEAVATTIAQAGADDVILVAGKGHEDYQIIGREYLPYNERAWVAEVLA
ncbi:UDP-N-acetylmuramoyl-L-alanyl-D-glutamate--2,6-diaminopimelate ligase [Pseudidiomarina sp. GXY010]|uniref:UDP-N-acetylmuramoyl-L-alanyl-D-glutamate--2,6-diaminopimelate ligase n=1 Tax=Pseudidiomarina fusca TaxID=2965078 RepID=A0ABU3KXR3_9GAMM|nr:UDP-N-acetylmuramoyl-L-alanyl-D-glutamate--2,6-diaminopimelate ligase [Pseudidiomarina sp. GXY010]MDT7525936.1 UDP-N-acetylmuramoyl-L-alanyl-D-glutamate--2,6-diaminopimelate ligase [Pseudidiomarina sp. GXY010]